MPAIAYPVPRLFSDVIIEVTGVFLDGEALPDHNIDPLSRSIMLFSSGRANWSDAEIAIRIEAPLQELKGKELDDDSTFALVRLNCGRTNLRSSELVSLKNGIADCRLSLRKEQVAEKATLECFIVRDTSEGFARIIREAETWQVAFVQPRLQPSVPRTARPGGFRELLDVQWIDFKDVQRFNGQLTAFSHEAYYLDLETDSPSLYLNDSIEGYKALLTGDIGSKTESLFRELETKRIALGVWLAISFEAISCITVGPDREPEPPEGWRAEVLKLVLPRIFPGDSLESAYQKVITLRGTTGTSAFLLSRLEIAVNELINSSTTLKKFLIALMRDGGA
jgi:hypothetical protein